MNKTEILNIVNEPSKHIQIVKIDGKDSIVYSAKFVELLELIPTMLTKDEVTVMLTELRQKVDMMSDSVVEGRTVTITSWKGMQKRICKLIQSKIDKLKENTDGNNEY